MADYPDFTFQGSVDIVAQTIGNLAVNIAAQALSALKINITAQDLAQLIINIAAQSVGVYLQPEWAAKEGIDKSFYKTGTNKAPRAFANLNYPVPTGKTLYIVHVSFFGYASLLADSDNNQMVGGQLADSSIPTVYWFQVGNGGGGLSFDKPIVIPALHVFTISAYNESNHNMEMGIAAMGYEI